MNYNELRVGNHVYIDSKETEISAQDLLVLAQKDRLPLADDIVSPIFLSESLLLRLGFKVEFEVSPYRVYSINGFLLRSNADRTFLLYVGQQVVGRPIAYLHQLQNLYFCLMGQELLSSEAKNSSAVRKSSGLPGLFGL